MDKFNFKQKNDWRNRCWNEAIKRSRQRSKTGIVLYLPGLENFDAWIARKKKIPQYNLVAVESDRKIVKKLRKDGQNVIHGDLYDVLKAWPLDGYKIFYVSADLFCGLEKKYINIFDHMFTPNTINSIITINMQRGRDPSSKGSRDLVSHDGIFQVAESVDVDCFGEKVNIPGAQMLTGIKVAARVELGRLFYERDGAGSEKDFIRDMNWKHRGLLFLIHHIIDATGVAISKGKAHGMTYYEATAATTYDFFHICKPLLMSYQSSSGLYFDSVIMKSYGRAVGAGAGLVTERQYDKFWKFAAKQLSITREGIMSDVQMTSDPESVKRKISAALAIRTQRMNAA